MVVQIFFEKLGKANLYRIAGIKNCLTRDQIPTDYLNQTDYFYLSSEHPDFITLRSTYRSPVGSFRHEFTIGETISGEFKEWFEGVITRGSKNLRGIKNKEKYSLPGSGNFFINELWGSVGKGRDGQGYDLRLPKPEINLESFRQQIKLYTDLRLPALSISPDGMITDPRGIIGTWGLPVSVISSTCLPREQAKLWRVDIENMIKAAGASDPHSLGWEKFNLLISGGPACCGPEKAVKVVLKNELDRGEMAYRVVSISGVKEIKDLPVEYIKSDTTFHMSRSGAKPVMNIKFMPENSEMSRMVSIKEGDILSPELRKILIDTLRKGAVTLAKIESRLDELRNTWEGIEEIIEV